MQIGNRFFDFSKTTYIMGILNVTPDSFSDGGSFIDPAHALARAVAMEREGAHVIDVGAESTRPGAEPVSEAEEWRRLEPVLHKILPILKIPVSIDTSKTEIARRALDLGVSLINDINALQSPGMIQLVAERQVPCVLMHKKGDPKTMQLSVHYDHVVSDVLSFLKQRIHDATRGGIKREQILIDPGLGFGKRAEDNWVLLQHLKDFHALECPVVLGASRKSFVAKLVGDNAPAKLSGSLAIAAWALVQRVGILRVHDVAETVAMLHAFSRLGGPVLSS